MGAYVCPQEDLMGLVFDVILVSLYCIFWNEDWRVLVERSAILEKSDTLDIAASNLRSSKSKIETFLNFHGLFFLSYFP